LLFDYSKSFSPGKLGLGDGLSGYALGDVVLWVVGALWPA